MEKKTINFPQNKMPALWWNNAKDRVEHPDSSRKPKRRKSPLRLLVIFVVVAIASAALTSIYWDNLTSLYWKNVRGHNVTVHRPDN